MAEVGVAMVCEESVGSYVPPDAEDQASMMLHL